MIALVVAPATVGGLESVVAQLLRAAHEANEPMALVALLDADAPMPMAFEALQGLNVSIVRVDAPHRQYFRQYRNVREALHALNATLAHTHGAHADVLGGAAARALGISHVSTLHGFVSGGLKSRLFEWLELRQLRGAAAVIGVSAGVIDRANASGVPAHALHLIPNATSEFSLLDRAIARKGLNLPAGGPVVGWVGRVSPEKGPDAFVRVLEMTDPEHSVVGVMIGDGSSLPEVRRRGAALVASGRLVLAGSIPEARQWLSALDVLALTSVTEGTPMVVLEAMRAKVPVVSTRVGGVPKLLADGAGVLVEHGDWGQFAREIQRMLTIPTDAKNVQERAYQRVCDVYGMANWWTRHYELYRRYDGH